MKLRIAKKIAKRLRHHAAGSLNRRLTRFRTVARAGERLGELEGAIQLYCDCLNRVNKDHAEDYLDDWDAANDDFGDSDDRCPDCGGDGWGIVGLDWESDDPINGPYPGESQQCPNCHGSGKAEDCTTW